MLVDWTPVEYALPDPETQVLVCSANDEKFMGFWDGEIWLEADSELPFSGEISGRVLLDDIPGIEETLLARNRIQKLGEEVERLKQQIETMGIIYGD
ncbi:MAG: hypothetical protein JXR40_06865 [Pontiellaceae bacterium]|nr:hypothetical protein [Pontiellaceae bacterium]